MEKNMHEKSDGSDDKRTSEHEAETAASPELRKEICDGLSRTWFKTVQEILPGRLPNRPASELSTEELLLYRDAYRILVEKVEKGEVEMSSRKEESRTSGSESAGSELMRPQFRIRSTSGREVKDIDPAEDELAADLST